jgi:hypothetical protein
MWWARLLNNVVGFLGTASPIVGDYESIATAIVGSGGQSTITFNTIPSTYKHLQIRALTRGTYAASGLSILLNLNGTGTSGYRHHLYGNGSGTPSAYADGGAYGTIGGEPGSTVTSNVFGGLVLDILDYTNTNKTKVMRYFAGWDANGSGEILLGSANTAVTSALTSISLTTDGNFAQYSHFALYGIKG